MAQKKLLEKQEVVDVIEFAQNLWAAEKYGLYTPWLQNQLLNNLNNNILNNISSSEYFLPLYITFFNKY